MIWAADASADVEAALFAGAGTVAAPKIAAPAALVHRIRDPSALHSQAGHALVASDRETRMTQQGEL